MERASASRTVWRGVRRRCGRCGSGGIFRSWFQLHERCPRCGYRFEREEGFFTGVYLINYGLTALLLVALLFAFLLVTAANDGDVSPVPWVVAGALVAIVAPIIGYPFAKSTWAAIDLVARPLEPVEEAEAARFEDDETQPITRDR